MSTSTRNLILDLIRATEAAALNAAQWVGRGEKIAGDGAAVEATRKGMTLQRSGVTSVVVGSVE
jgi:fructose-1,6-bisphosphatase II